MKFTCTVEPHYEDPAFQILDITALSCEEEERHEQLSCNPQSAPENNGLPYETFLGSITAFRYLDPNFLADDFPDYAWEVMDGESGDLEKIAHLMREYGHKTKYKDGYEEYGFAEKCAGFIVIDRLLVAPFARGHGIGGQLLKQARQIHAGQLFYCALTAEPYSMEVGPERASMEKRLISWYKRQANMHLAQLAPRKHPEFLMGPWDGRNLENTFPEIENIAKLVEDWKVCGKDASKQKYGTETSET